MTASALVIEDVVKYFPVPQTGVRAFLNPFAPLTHPALLGVSFQVGAGEVAGLIGANGSGKSTLLRILATLLRPTAGTLTVAGIDALRDPERARAAIGMVGHRTFVYEDLTALENLQFWTVMGNGDASRGRLIKALTQVELEAMAEERVRTFSAGMKRRLGLARVLLGQASVLLLDEPFTGIDPIAIGDIQEIVGRLKERGIGILITDHNVRETLAITDRAYILYDGKILVSGTANEIANNPIAREIYLGEKFSL